MRSALCGRRSPNVSRRRGTEQSRWGFRGKKVWDWLQLLIVPFVLAVIGFYFTSAQEYAHQLELEARRAAEARELEEQRLQNTALQTYLAGMRELLLDNNLRDSEEDSEVRAVARAQTRATLLQLSPEGKGIALQFLYESALVHKGNPIVDLENADLSEANLRLDNLSEADLSYADLSGADLSYADLSEAVLTWANLSGAVLDGANLTGPT
jgi:cell division protein FtsB